MDAVARLSDYLPRESWTTDAAERAARTHDWWPRDAVRRRSGAPGAVPDIVILPRSTAEVAAALRWATACGVPTVPRGGGSGVCGGALVAGPGHAVLDLSRMDRVLDLDQTSGVVHVEAGIRGARLEESLNDRGLTLGHSPQSVALSSVGGWIATASAGQFTPAYGAIEDRLLGYTAVTGDGEVFEVQAQPRSAALPNLRRLLLGSEGTLAVVTEASLACARLPDPLVWRAYQFPGFEDAFGWARRIVRADLSPHVLRGYDEADALAAFFEPFGHRAGAVGMIAFQETSVGLDARIAAATSAAEEGGAQPTDPAYGSHWLAHRLDAVEMFDRINGPARALGEGSMLDTMEVAACWRDLPALYARVGSAIGAAASEVRCHFSHVYESGAALYFTFVLRAADDAALETMSDRVWESAIDACLEAGGTTTHHHGMGRLHAPFADRELGSGPAMIFRRLKQVFDPAGVLNPGAILSPSRPPSDNGAPAGSDAVATVSAASRRTGTL